jgi:hypothetical protein
VLGSPPIPSETRRHVCKTCAARRGRAQGLSRWTRLHWWKQGSDLLAGRRLCTSVWLVFSTSASCKRLHG